MNDPVEIIVPIAGMIMIIALAVGIPLVRALGRKWEREASTPKIPAELMARLERIETGIDTMAVEVERISEGQRFTTRLLSERVKEPASNG
ncbi:MAG: hypothetical protein JWO05_616 [Gemmatimonadetes bacterium]|nr:hypothetical protein [Gemmatimonadota bacterium]